MKLMMFLVLFCLTGCLKEPTKEEVAAQEKEQYENSIGFRLKGNHELLSLKSTDKTETKISGGYFLFIGGISGKTSTENIVKFIYKNYLGQYVPTTLPYSMIRFEIKDTATPYVKFRWSRHRKRFDGSDMDFVIYAVFVINKNQISSDIKFDL